MKGTRILLMLFCIALLSGCAARSTNDPTLKLTWAAEEFRWKKDPIAAEELLHGSLEIYRKQMNRLGLAETYRQYGLFLRSHSVTKSKEHYQREGFLDETIHYNTRYEKALEYFNKSREIFAELNNAEMLTNVYLSMAKTYALMNKVPESCENLDKGRKSYAPLKGLQVETREAGVDDDDAAAANYEAYITLMQAQMGCPMEMTAGVALDNRIK
jgi:tetratricopeptide (TPR) repeat protein